jgi:hypothetical protein
MMMTKQNRVTERAQESDGITRLADARAMRAMNLPLNTPVIEGEFSPQSHKQIEDAWRAGLALKKHAFTFLENPNMSSYKALRKTYEKLARRIMEANEDAEPRYVEQPDGTSTCVNHERVAVASFVNKVSPCCQGWQDIFDAADASGSVSTESLQHLWPFNGVNPFDESDRA